MWNDHGIKVKTTIVVHVAVILTSLLYRCEARIPYQRHLIQLDLFHLHCLCKIVKNTWKDRVPNTEVLQHMQVSGTESLLTKLYLRWVEHMALMDDLRLQNQYSSP